MTSSPVPKIGVIICSQRLPRIGDQIGTLIYKTLTSLQPTDTSASQSYTLSLIDLADHPLPFFNEPIIPQMITNPADYHHAHTRAWSALISSHAAFVFVTPQYNWSFPANLKNAVDYLFNEWVGKPAMIVSYGGHGGGHSAAQLTQVLKAVRMRVVSRSVGLMFPKDGSDGREFTKKAFRGVDLGLGWDGEEGKGVWKKEMEDVKEVFGELVGMLQTGVEEKGK
ncbi:hypothetical protein H2200_004574 [Cladophialophora chaetospira]|uniref:NADPH-dependent FMN reductase-like domain-containing protein n=1 Tax=Cladophialophora chaetospira TaxID=386627 RepID=A0AA39CKB0_9EURO|nr:hypothetical protein H2200_004574 [Cladophialophora chaetospira]